MTPRLPSWLATLQPPCLGREPKARVATVLDPNSELSSNSTFVFAPYKLFLVSKEGRMGGKKKVGSEMGTKLEFGFIFFAPSKLFFCYIQTSLIAEGSLIV